MKRIYVSPRIEQFYIGYGSAMLEDSQNRGVVDEDKGDSSGLGGNTGGDGPGTGGPSAKWSSGFWDDDETENE